MIPIQKPLFDDEEKKAVNEVLASGWVTQGPKVAEFEEVVASYIGTKYAIATTSATTALFMALKLFDVGPGDEVIVPSFTFIATVNVIVHAGATPIFVDIDPLTYNLDPKEIERKITKKTKVIMPVDQIGMPCDMDQINEIAKEHKLIVVEDAAPAIGSEYNGEKVGAKAPIACFSFHPRKVITTGEGGMITTNDKELADKARALRHHGMNISDVARHDAKKVIHEEYTTIGYNFRMTDIQAAIGIEQMKKLPEILVKREKLVARYTKAFWGSNLIVPPFVPESYKHNWQTYVIRLKENSTISRDELMQKLADSGISTRRGVMASHLEKPYQNMFGKISLPETEKATLQTIALPLYPTMTLAEQDLVIDSIIKLTK